MKIHVIPSGPIQTIGYLLTDTASGQAVLVDAPAGITDRIAPVLQKEQCKLAELWLTHGHWDHTQDAARLKRELGVTVLAHEADRALIETPEVMSAFLGREIQLEPVTVDRWIGQGDQLQALGRKFEVRHVPGHCPGNVLFHQPEARVALVGDALFNRGVGRWDLPGGNFEVLARSIREQIYTLPDDTVVLPGHGPRTTVREEKAENPYVPAAS